GEVGADARGRAPPPQGPEQQGREFPPADAATRTADEAVHQPARRNGSSPPTTRSTTSSTSTAITSPPPSTEPSARKPSRSGPRSRASRLPHEAVAPMSDGASLSSPAST